MTLRPASSVPMVLDGFIETDASMPKLVKLLLPKFTSFARVLNPARTHDGRAVRWDEVASGFVDARTQWRDVVEHASCDIEELDQPEMGSYDAGVTSRLAQLLVTRTTTPTDCYFLVWEGYAGLRDDLAEGATVFLAPHQCRMHVLHGTVLDASEAIESRPSSRLPMWWIPADGAWCVGNDIYGRNAFVAADADVINEILNTPELQAYAADPQQVVAPEDR